MANIEKIAEDLSKLTILEAAELTKLLEEKWGVSAAAPVAVAAVAGAGAGPGEDAEEKTEFDVIIKDVGPKKIDVIKAIRQITQLGSRAGRKRSCTGCKEQARGSWRNDRIGVVRTLGAHMEPPLEAASSISCGAVV
jgi:large subunit ribosomal protein L7/L12